MEIRFPAQQLRRCAKSPRRAHWHDRNAFETLASVASRLAPGWPMVTRLVRIN